MIKDLRIRTVELGKIKIGSKGPEITSARGTTFRPPVKLDHFLVTGMDRDDAGDLRPDANLMRTLAAAQGIKPEEIRELPIALLDDEIENVFPTAYVAYVGKTRLAQSDGEMIIWFCDPKTGEALPEPRVVPNRNEYVQTATTGSGDRAVRVFKPHGVLSCVIAAGASRFGGVYKFRTASMISIEQIYSGLMTIKNLTGGFLRNVPLRLVLRPVQVAPLGRPIKVHVVHVEMRGADLTDIQRQVLEVKRMEIANTRDLAEVQRSYIALLSAPGAAEETPEEQADMNAEFAPETIDGAAVPAPPADVAPTAGPTVTIQPPEPRRKKKEPVPVPAAAPVPVPAPVAAPEAPPPPVDDEPEPSDAAEPSAAMLDCLDQIAKATTAKALAKAGGFIEGVRRAGTLAPGENEALVRAYQVRNAEITGAAPAQGAIPGTGA